MIDIEIFLNDNGWDYDEMQMHIPTHVVEHVKQNMKYVRQDDVSDRPWWTKTCSGKFTVKSAWELPRKRKVETDFYKKLWVKGLPFKISFLTWKVWTNKISVATLMAQWNSNTSPMCGCCEVPVRETVEHLFLQGKTATTVWAYFSNAAGLLGPWIQGNK
ncbi:hypothetical protein KY285_023447 [Solanum tuberosum]|nr:hypothetical protein KY289_023781 [Solanum tuberosum]KAH0675646.1 hypothetical protein KY285_023447 [Solanum tuberosum]